MASSGTEIGPNAFEMASRSIGMAADTFRNDFACFRNDLGTFTNVHMSFPDDMEGIPK